MSHERDDVEIWHIDQDGLSEWDAPLRGMQAPSAEPEKLPLVVTEPMDVRFFDRTASLDRQGLYMFHYRGRLRWSDPDARPSVVKRIHTDAFVIYFHNDLAVFFAGLATLHVHGWIHNALELDERLSQMKRGLVSCTCGAIVEIAVHLLTSLGYRARPVGGLRVQGQYNARDDAHVLMEVFDPDLERWILVDLDTHSIFAWEDKLLNLGEVADCIHAGQQFDIVPITPPGFAMPDTTSLVAPETSQTHMTFKLLSAPHLRQWLEQMLVVPSMTTGGQRCFWHPDDAVAARVMGRCTDARRLDRDDWFDCFYLDQGPREASR